MRRVSVLSVKRIGTTVTILLVLIFVTALAAQPKESAGLLRAGAAKIDITPEEPVRMAGYRSRTGLSEGVHDPLSARVVAFANKGKRLVLVSTDLIGFSRGTAGHRRRGGAPA